MRERWSCGTQDVVIDEGTETLVRTLVDHFVAFGGVPLCALFDRPPWRGTASHRIAFNSSCEVDTDGAVPAMRPWFRVRWGAVNQIGGWLRLVADGGATAGRSGQP